MADILAAVPITRRTLLRGLVVAAAVPVLTPAPAFAAGRKWHPGHYVWLPHARRPADIQRSLAATPHLTGIKLRLDWADIEGREGDYSPGFRIVDAYLEKLASLGKHLMVQVNERAAGGSVAPQYVVDGGGVVARSAGESWGGGSVAVVARMWRPAVMDRLIALSRAFAARYDSHPLFEQFSIGETALAVPARHGFSARAWQTQLQRWFTESKEAWTTTYLRLNATSLSNDAGMRELITHCVNTTTPGGVTVGGPNPELPLPTIARFITANRVFRGHDGGADLRGKVPWTGEVQAMGLRSRYARTPEEITAYFHDTMHANHVVWLHDTAQHWPAVLTHLDSIQGRVHTARPTIG